MGIKEEFKHELEKVLHDVDLSVSKTWHVTYKGHHIRFENSMSNERLYINDQLVDEVIHRSLLSHLKPMSILTGTITFNDGATEKVTVKIGGIIKLSIHIKVGKQTLLKEKKSIDILPWTQKESIVSFIEGQVAEHENIVNPRLPDTDYLYNVDHTVKPGYLDYVGYDNPLPFFEKRLVKQIKQLLNYPTIKKRRIIYEKVNDEYISTYGGTLLYYLQEEDIDYHRLQEEALWFLEHGAHREIVKFALLLLSLTDVKQYKDKLYTIALHEEFTSYAILGLSQLEDGQHLLWELYDQLNGWGKVAVMHHLHVMTDERKMSFLRQTFADDEMNRAAALLIANTVELDVLLFEDNIDHHTLTQIGVILLHLLKENEDCYRPIEDYEYAPIVLKQFLIHITQNDIDCVMLIEEMRQFINDREDVWEDRYMNGWEPHEREAIIDLLTEK